MLLYIGNLNALTFIYLFLYNTFIQFSFAYCQFNLLPAPFFILLHTDKHKYLQTPQSKYNNNISNIKIPGTTTTSKAHTKFD